MTPHEEIRHHLKRLLAEQTARWGKLGGLYALDDLLEKWRSAAGGPAPLVDECHREISQRICELKIADVPRKILKAPAPSPAWVKNLEERAMITNHEDQGGAHVGQWLGAALARWRNNPGRTVVTLEDAACLEKTKHVRRPASDTERWVGDPNVRQVLVKTTAENLAQFIARTGLSKAQISTMSRDDISNFVATREDDVHEPKLAKSEQEFLRTFKTLESPAPTNAVLVG